MEADPSATIKVEYLMSYAALLGREYSVDHSLFIAEIKEGGWIRYRISRAGSFHLAETVCESCRPGISNRSVRHETDDGVLIYTSYNEVLRQSADSEEKFVKGKLMTTNFAYCIAGPVFQTASPKYAWHNDVQAAYHCTRSDPTVALRWPVE